MSDQRAQTTAQMAGSNQLNVTPGPAILSIVFTKADGTAVGSPIRIEVPRQLSKRLVTMYLLEMIGKLVKAQMATVVTGLGW